MDDQSYLRNIPKQTRSLKRFHHILDVADKLFAQHGYDAVSTNHIADGAGIPIGSVYHFFPDKDIILQALLDRYRAQLGDVLPHVIAPPRQIADILDEMMTNLHAFSLLHPHFERLLQMGTIDKTHALHHHIVGWVSHMLEAQFPQLDPHQREICAKTGVAMMIGIFNLTHAPFHLTPTDMSLQARTALIGYLQLFLSQVGVDDLGHIGRIG